MAGFLSEDAETVSAPLGENLPARFAAGQFLANRFRVIRFIAKGGMGEVYEAQDLELSTPVAIKMIRPDLLNAEFLDRFKREVQIAKRVTHPNVCRVYDLFRHSDETGAPIYLISMELLSGETLARRLRGTKTARSARGHAGYCSDRGSAGIGTQRRSFTSRSQTREHHVD